MWKAVYLFVPFASWIACLNAVVLKVVTKLNDEAPQACTSDCSLRSAWKSCQDSNLAFPSEHCEISIGDLSGGIIIDKVYGSLEIWEGALVSLTGNGALITSSGNFTLFEYLPPITGENPSLLIDGVTFSGYTGVGQGAVIHSNSSINLKFDSVVFVENFNIEGCGGAIFVSNNVNGGVTIDNCTFIDNFAHDGGGVCLNSNNTGGIIIRNSNFDCFSYPSGQGGCIYIGSHNRNVTLQSNSFEQGRVYEGDDNGDDGYSYFSTLSRTNDRHMHLRSEDIYYAADDDDSVNTDDLIHDDDYVYNGDDGDDRFDDAWEYEPPPDPVPADYFKDEILNDAIHINSYNEYLYFTGLTVTNMPDQTVIGIGSYNKYVKFSNLQVNNVEYSIISQQHNNNIEVDSSIVLQNADIVFSIAGDDIAITNCFILNSGQTRDAGGRYIGAVQLYGTKITFSNNNINNYCCNIALYIPEGHDITIANNIFHGIYIGIMANGTNLSIVNTAFTSVAHDGLYLETFDTIEIQNVTFTDAHFRGIFINGGDSVVTMNNVTVTDSELFSDAIVMYSIHDSIVKNIYIENAIHGMSVYDIHDVLFSNMSFIGLKDGFLASGVTNMILQNSLFEHLTERVLILSSSSLYVSSKNVTIRNSIFQHNKNTGLQLDGSEYVNIDHILVDNCTTVEKGGGLYSTATVTHLTIANSTFRNNYCKKSGGGLYFVTATDLVITNTQILNNTADLDGGGIYIGHSSSNVYIMNPESIEPITMDTPDTWTTIEVTRAIGYIVRFICNQPTTFDNTVILQYAQFDLAYTYPDYIVQDSKLTIYMRYSYCPVYIYPIFRSRYATSNIISGNTAFRAGGGIYLGYSNNLINIVSADITNNRAINGGGIYMVTANWLFNIVKVKFDNNTATIDGGGITMSSSQYGGMLYKCSFTNNKAVSLGGGIKFSTGNGNNELLSTQFDDDHNNEIKVTSVSFVNNIATEGGGVYVGELNNLIFSNVDMINNTASNGGGVYIANQNKITLSNAELVSNTALLTGGGIYSQESIITMTDVTLTRNQAILGAGMISKGADVTFKSNALFSENIASEAGGAIAVVSGKLWNNDGAQFNITSNQARRGSAIFMSNIKKEIFLNGTNIVGNVAEVGGTVFAVKSLNSYMPPTYDNVTWFNNSAPYGEKYTSQAVKINVPANYNVTVFGASLVPSIDVTLQDYYNQTIPLTGDTVVSVAMTNSHCFDNFPFLSGPDVTGVIISNGVASFASLEVYCAPRGNMTLQFTAELGSLIKDLPIEKASSYYLSASTDLYFRECEEGEYITRGMCVKCPFGSYTLVKGATYCSECSQTGVDACIGSELILEPGYWRRYFTNNAVLQCPLGSQSCVGGNSTGDSSCAAGYEGTLCAICAPGYFASDSLCIECTESGSSGISSTQIAAVLIVAMVILVSALFIGKSNFMKLYEFAKTQADAFSVKLKIIIATYQIVTSTSSVINVKLPGGFTRLMRAVKVLNLNLGSLFPLGCAGDYTYMEVLLWTTVSPLLLSGGLLLGYLFEYGFNCWKSGNNKTFEQIKDRYINYFFYLTYLVLPSVTTTIFQIFICTNADPLNEDSDSTDYFLAADMSVSCQSDYYYNWVTYAAIMIVVYPIGIPLMYYGLLYMHKEELKNRNNESTNSDDCLPDTSKRDRIAFLWEAYEPRYWYWEVIETTRRVLLTAVLSVILPGSSTQNILSILFSLLYIKLYGYFHPYINDSDDTLAELGQFQIFFTFFAGLIVQNQMMNSKYSIALDVLLVMVNMSIPVATLYYEWKAFQQERKIMISPETKSEEEGEVAPHQEEDKS